MPQRRAYYPNQCWSFSHLAPSNEIVACDAPDQSHAVEQETINLFRFTYCQHLLPIVYAKFSVMSLQIINSTGWNGQQWR